MVVEQKALLKERYTNSKLQTAASRGLKLPVQCRQTAPAKTWFWAEVGSLACCDVIMLGKGYASCHLAQHTALGQHLAGS